MTETRDACGGGNDGILCLVLGGEVGPGPGEVDVEAEGPAELELGGELGVEEWSGLGASRAGFDAVENRLELSEAENTFDRRAGF